MLNLAKRGILVLFALSVMSCSEHKVAKPAEPGPKAIGKPFVSGQRAARFLYALVDVDGIYFGGVRTDPKIANAVLEELLTREGVRNIVVRYTPKAKHGTFVSFWASIDRRKYFVAQIDRFPRRAGYPLPLCGTFLLDSFGEWVDSENGEWLPE